ncbi:MAG: peptidoglycan DD-metalloendopeptidase family protein [Methylococcaceae bacterium]|nr:peptidoglycan DD-metalloendopeptidase family protein [Methylococcaceae bacterium]MDZ4157651.1 peptidoglycan DD-metalloendopeptidase family protein [Methylococcales bacterium]MDP2393097.1 peptidoglycan DD-metalloendopeptidase family protein [Methylococcaceae bacterium]MDP3019241.1 peptidoglycan DD-metalloendopeptidase family protein [Methylococcaceae bacterium]MDP3389178.1 peptidoglycan DD-metalloendopeptidase family protein [Methylococcaceae bacterium]
MIKKIIYCFLLSFYLTPGSANVTDHSSVNEQLAEIEKLYGRTAALLRTLEKQVELKQNNLSKIRKEMTLLQNEVAKQSKELAGQIKAAHAMGQQEKLKLLLNQKDPALSSRMLVYYDYLNAARVSKLSHANDSMTQLASLEQRQQEETSLLEKDLEQQRAERINADNARENRARLLNQLGDDYFANEQQLNRLKESESKLKNLIASLQLSTGDAEVAVERVEEQLNHQTVISASVKGSDSEASFPVIKGYFSELKGTLPWPVTGQLRNKFGNADGGAWADGVLIDAKEGADIRAVTNGAVVYADWLKGYGWLMIVNHGEGYMTLYAFNQSLYKHKGEKVDAGEVIAAAGQSGGNGKSGLYFGIRKKGKPVDPIAWCRQ